MPAIPVIGKLRQEDREFEATLGSMVDTCVKIKI